jgi:Sulfotransferase domain
MSEVDVECAPARTTGKDKIMSLKVIGAGMGRTGTLSLKFALEQIGYGPCYHMTEVMLNPEAPSLWVRAANGDPDWEATFNGFLATVDFPGCTFWRDLSDYYPQAKVLLSVRDPEQWFESTQATIFSEPARQMLLSTPMGEFVEKTTWKVFGTDRLHDRDVLIPAFNRHNEEVKRTIPPDRLLVYEVSQGWEPLCNFLGVPVPDKPFPRVNSRDEMKTFMSRGRDPNASLDPAVLREVIKARLGRS